MFCLTLHPHKHCELAATHDLLDEDLIVILVMCGWLELSIVFVACPVLI